MKSRLRSWSVAVAVGALLIAGCSDTEPEATPDPASEPTVDDSTEPADDEVCVSFEVEDAVEVATADLDGDGKDDVVRYLDDGVCQALIGRDGTSPLETGDLNLDQSPAIGVLAPPGLGRELLVAEGTDEENGAARRVYLIGEVDSALGIVTDRGQPVLPAREVGESAEEVYTADCGPRSSGGTLEITTAEIVDPAALNPVWDVETIGYRFDGLVVVPTTRDAVEGVADDQLRSSRPELFSGALFGTCQSD